jgi:hypothetical protein
MNNLILSKGLHHLALAVNNHQTLDEVFTRLSKFDE